MYQAQRDQQRRRTETAACGTTVSSTGLITGSAKRKRTLRLEERKSQEIHKRKSHKLMRQISDESSDENSEKANGDFKIENKIKEKFEEKRSENSERKKKDVRKFINFVVKILYCIKKYFLFFKKKIDSIL